MIVVGISGAVMLLLGLWLLWNARNAERHAACGS